MKMTPEQLEREQRLTRIVSFTSVLGAVAVLVGNAMQGSGVSPEDDEAERLIDRADAFGSILAGSVLSGIGFLLLGATVIFLFDAARRRSDAMASSVRPLLFIGPILLAVSGILTAVGYDSVANDFIAGDPTSGDAGVDRADDLVADSGLLQFGGFTGLAGLAAFAFGLIYAALYAMRTGLLTRFSGTLGMAFGAAFLLSAFLGPIGFLGMTMWVAVVGLQARGAWPGIRPPAWDAGEAVPWPAPGESPPRTSPPEQEASPEDFEGTATEVEEPADRPGRRDNKRKRKRKQRG